MLSVVTVTSQAALLLCKPYSCIPEICSVLTIPELKDQTILQEKIRQLNVAIAQFQRSATKLPTVLLLYCSTSRRFTNGTSCLLPNILWSMVDPKANVCKCIQISISHARDFVHPLEE